MLKAATVLQQIMTEPSEAVSDRDKIMIITKMAFNETKWPLVLKPLKVIPFNNNVIWRQHYELNKQQQDLHIDVVLLSKTHLSHHEGFFISD
jgi:hypothetical protein